MTRTAAPSATGGNADDPEPTFPNARHLVQQTELDYLGERPGMAS